MSYYGSRPFLLKNPPAAPPSNVIEDYEGTPLVSDFTWTKNLAVMGGGTSTVTVTQSTSHVTQGTNTWRMQGTTSGGNPVLGICTTTTDDISAYTTLEIDVFVQSIAGDETVTLQISDDPTGSNVYGTDGPIGGTGAYTIGIDLTDAGLFLDLTSIYFGTLVFVNSGGATDFYVDNLRVS